MIVVDASIVFDALRGHLPVAARLVDETLAAPHLIDVEIASATRSAVAGGELTPARAEALLDDFADLDILRYQHTDLLPRVWELRHNLSAYDAAYAALAEWLDEPLVTRDARLARAPGVKAKVELLPVA